MMEQARTATSRIELQQNDLQQDTLRLLPKTVRRKLEEKKGKLQCVLGQEGGTLVLCDCLRTFKEQLDPVNQPDRSEALIFFFFPVLLLLPVLYTILAPMI